MNVFKLAWRNLWRNKRRTLITIASIFFGVILSSLMGSMQEGSYRKMIDNVVKFYSGFMQVQHEDYWGDKTINNTFTPDEEMLRQISQNPDITMIVPRLEDFALAAYGNTTRGGMIVGIQPGEENQLTGIANKIVQGTYLSDRDDGLLVGEELARTLKVQIGDTLVLLGQGYHGVSAAGKYPIRGFIKHFNPEFNRRIIYMQLANCQHFYTADNLLTSLVLMVEDNDRMTKMLPELKEEIASPYTVISWEEMFPAMLQQIESDRSTALFMKVILYIVIGFGIFGTIMMMMAERRHEFGVMVAVGMPRARLAVVVVIETILIGFLGVVAGLIGTFPVVGYFALNPIPIGGNGGEFLASLGFEPFMFFAWDPMVFIYQMLAVFVMTLFIALFPLRKLLRINEIQALKD
jgi:ABC-type lipoprotein release transport system permease subunit